MTHKNQVRFHSPKVAVKSRIGAGDSTVAGIVLGLTKDMGLKEAVMFGIACGASTVMSPEMSYAKRVMWIEYLTK